MYNSKSLGFTDEAIERFSVVVRIYDVAFLSLSIEKEKEKRERLFKRAMMKPWFIRELPPPPPSSEQNQFSD